MRQMIMILGAVVTLACSEAWAGAGHDQGNGGNVVVCGGQVELVDHYEARVLRKIKIDLGSSSLSFTEKVALAISRIEKLNPTRFHLYKLWAGQFLNETLFTDEDLIPLSDNGPGTIPSGCELKQIAIQQTPNLPGDNRYIIRKALWDQLDNDGKAGLVLHEIVYRELIHQKYLPHTTSKFARYFNALLSSDVFSAMNLKTYFDTLYLLDFERGDAQNGTEIGLYDCSYENICTKKLPTFWNDDLVRLGITPFRDFDTDSSVAFWRGNYVKISSKSVKFSKDGEIAGDLDFRDPVHLQMGPINVSLKQIDSAILVHDDRDGGMLTVRLGRARFSWQNRDIDCGSLTVSWASRRFYCDDGTQGSW